MSKTIDERVVSMQFDNRHFESNVKTTMSTLDKLKAKLNLDGASKGLESIDRAAKKVSFDPMAESAERLAVKFSHTQATIQHQIDRITDSVVNSAERMIKALTIDPIKTGFQEYETQINAVQTILSNTKSKGSTIDDVNKALEELNKYADMTIYNFTEMTRNIGTFTAAGVELDTSVNAIKGIANLAAMSGSTSQQASTAMYQLSQAMSSGTVRLMDWNSVVNAGMGGELFQNALKETARVYGVNIDAIIEKEGSFRESLKHGWLSTEILTDTLQKFTMTTEGLTDAQIEANRQMYKAKGYTDAQIDAIFELGKDATDAATKVKTLTQLWDVLKEAAQSGWAQTWKIIVGDYEEAKELFSPLAEYLTGFINLMSDWRNSMLEGAMNNPFKVMLDMLDNSGLGKIKEVVDETKAAADMVAYYQDVVTKVWRGDYNNWGDDPDRRDLLAAAGYDHRVVQGLVDKGYQYKITLADIQEQQKRFGVAITETADSTEAMAIAFEELTDDQLREAGLTEEQIKLFRDLAREAERTGKPLRQLIEEMSSRPGGRMMLIESLKNAASGLVGIFKAIGEAWIEIFPPMTSMQLYNIIAAIYDFSQKLRMTDKETGALTDTADKLKRTLKGVFAILDVVLTIVGGGARIALKIVGKLLEFLGFGCDSILTLTANVGDALVAFRDWFDSLFDFTILFEALIPLFSKVKDAFLGWVKSLRKSDNLAYDIVVGIANGLVDGSKWIAEAAVNVGKAIIQKIKDVVSGKAFEGVSGDMLKGLVNGLKDGAMIVWDAIRNLGETILEKFKEVLGIHSPSVKFFEFGRFIIQGLVDGIRDSAHWVIDGIKKLGEMVASAFEGVDWTVITEPLSNAFDKFKELVGGFDFKKLMALIPIAAVLVMIWNISKIVKAFSDGIQGINELIESFALVGKKLASTIGAFGTKIRAEALKTVAVSIAILVAAILALAYFSDTDKLYDAVTIVVILAGVLIGLSFALEKMSKASVKVDWKTGIDIGGITASLMSIGLAMLMLAATVRVLGDMDPNEMKQGVLGFAGLVLAAITMLGAFKLMTRSGTEVAKVGGLLLGVSVAMFLMVGVCKAMSMLSMEDLGKGALFATGFALFVGLLVSMAKITRGNRIPKLTGLLLGVSVAMGLMVGVCKEAGRLSAKQMLKGAAFATGFALFVGLLVAVTKLTGAQTMPKLAGMLIGMSIAMTTMIGVCRLMRYLTVEDMAKGALFALGFIAFVGLLVSVTTIASDKKIANLSLTMLSMSASIAILAGLCVLMSMLDGNALAKGVGAVATLGLVMAAMLFAARNSNKAVGAVIAVTVAVAALVASVILLTTLDTGRLQQAVGAMALLMGMFAVLTAVSKLASFKNAAALAVVAIVVTLLAMLLSEMTKMDTTKAMDAVKSLSVLLTALSINLILLSAVGKLGAAGIIGAGILLAVVAAFGAIFWAIGLLPDIGGEIEHGIELFEQVANGIGRIIGAIYGGVISGVGSAVIGLLPDLGDNLTEFSDNVQGFIEGIKNANTDTLKGAGFLAGAIVAISVAELVNGLISLKSFGLMNLTSLGENLSKFIDGAEDFISGLSGMDPAMPAAATALADTIIKLTAAELLDAVSSFITGGSDLGDFGKSVAQLGEGLVEFKKSMGDFTEEDVKSVDLASKVLAKFADVAELLPNTGGVAGFFAGNNDLDKFATMIGVVGTGLKDFKDNIGDFAESDLDTVGYAAKSISKFAKVADEIPNIGGLLAVFTGDNLLDTFAGMLPAVGTHLSAFIDNIGSFKDKDVDTSTRAATAVGAFAKAADEIPNIGGCLSIFVGDNLLSMFTMMLPAVGTHLSAFIDNIGKFSESNLETATRAAGAIGAFAKVADEIPNIGGCLAVLVGDNGISTFASELPGVGEGLNEFIDSIGTFGEDEYTTSKWAARAIGEFADATKEIPNSGGILADIIGDNDLGDFSNDFDNLGEGLYNFIDSIGSFGEAEYNTVTWAAKAVMSIADASNYIPNTGGILAKIVGDNDLGSFSMDIRDLGSGLGKFIEKIGTFGEAEYKTIDWASQAIVSLALASNNIPTTGGWLQKIIGGVDLGQFARGIIGLGEGIKGFKDKVAGFTDEEVADIETGVEAITAFSKVAETTATLEDGWLDKITPGTDLDKFAKGLPNLGKGLAGFATEIDGTDTTNLDWAVKILQSFAGLSEHGLDTAAKNLDDFGDNLDDLSEGFAEFVKGMDSTTGSKITLALDWVKKVADGLKDLDTTGVINLETMATSLKNFSDNTITSIKDLFSPKEEDTINAKARANGILEAFVTALTDEGPDSAYTKLKEAIKGLSNGITEELNKFNGLATPGKEVDESVTTMHGVGHDFVRGFAGGIRTYKYEAVNAATEMAEAAVAAAKIKLDEHSPSKVAYGIGKFFVLGFSNAISDGTDDASRASAYMATSTKNSLSNAVNRLRDMIASDIDVQPTIRPVLDLTDVRSEAGTLGGLFGNRTIRVNNSSALGAAASMARVQNGSDTRDLLAAVKGLRGDIAEMPRNTYNVGGITYDDGSNVASAIESLIVAARIEGRI